jgi:hypothetical protein
VRVRCGVELGVLLVLVLYLEKFLPTDFFFLFSDYVPTRLIIFF